MAWWKFGKRAEEKVKADWIGERLAETLDPEPLIEEVRNRYHLPHYEVRPFVALASLRVAGVRIGLGQRSILSRVDKAIVVAVQNSFCSALVLRYGNKHSLDRSSSDLAGEVVRLANRIAQAFYANSRSKPPLPLPQWFACKEMVVYLQSGQPADNPEDMVIYSEYLSNGMRTAKAFVDELLARNVRVVE